MFGRSESDLLRSRETGEGPHRRFSFENDLLVSPVYKRVIFAALTLPFTKREGSAVKTELKISHNSLAGARPNDVDITETANPDEPPTKPLLCAERFGVSMEETVRVLKASGAFSIGTHADLEEIQQSADMYSLPRRSLPLHAILKQQQMSEEEQLLVNEKLLLGISNNDSTLVAQALDAGAEIDGAQGTIVLRLAFGEQRDPQVLALLLLYTQTNLQSRFENGATLLHLAVRFGKQGCLRRLVTNIDDLQALDGNGATPLHEAILTNDLAPAASTSVLREFKSIFQKLNINPDKILDQNGKTALHIAAEKDDLFRGVELLNLGCDPFLDRFYKSPFGLAARCESTDLAQKILEIHLKEPLSKRYPGQSARLDGFIQRALRRGEWRKLKALAKSGIRTDQLLPLVNSSNSGGLLMSFAARGCLPEMRPMDVTPSVRKIKRNCSVFKAIKVSKVLVRTSPPPFIYQANRVEEHSAFSASTLALEDLLVQIIFPQMRTAMQFTFRLTTRPNEEGRVGIIPQRGFDPDRLFDTEQIYYIQDDTDVSSIWKRVYYTLDEAGQPQFGGNARQLLSAAFDGAFWDTLQEEDDDVDDDAGDDSDDDIF
jgi:hypothetical protein